MNPLLGLFGLLDGAVQQGVTLGVGTVGVAVALRCLRYPDLTSDGSFLLGAVTFGSILAHAVPWPIAMVAATAAGGATGALTALVHHRGGTSRLLSGLLTSMICYSVGFWVLDGRPNVGLIGRTTVFSAAERWDAATFTNASLHPATVAVALLFAAAVAGALAVVLRSEWGLVLRATGYDERRVVALGRSATAYRTAGLVLANALVGTAGGLMASRQGFADVNMGPGAIVTFIASMVLGEELLRTLWPALRDNVRLPTAPIVGCVLYNLIFLAILQASISGWLPVVIRPTDLKLIAAGIIIVLVFVRSVRAPGAVHDVLPL